MNVNRVGDYLTPEGIFLKLKNAQERERVLQKEESIKIQKWEEEHGGR
jgi:hypothetical protein